MIKNPVGQSPSSKLTVDHPVKKFPILYVTKSSLLYSQESDHRLYFVPAKFILYSRKYYLTSILLLPSYLNFRLPSGSSSPAMRLKGSGTNISDPSHIPCLARPSYRPWRDHPSNIWHEATFTKLLFAQFCLLPLPKVKLLSSKFYCLILPGHVTLSFRKKNYTFFLFQVTLSYNRFPKWHATALSVESLSCRKTAPHFQNIKPCFVLQQSNLVPALSFLTLFK